MNDLFTTYEEAKAAVERYEAEDKAEGIFEADFYEIAPTYTADEARAWFCNPDNAGNCEDCPENAGFSEWPGHRLPCGQFHCWVDIHTAQDSEDDPAPAYTVYWIGGDRDGETLAEFDDENDAIRFACRFHDDHEDEFDPVCGGVGIDGPDGAVSDW